MNEASIRNELERVLELEAQALSDGLKRFRSPTGTLAGALEQAVRLMNESLSAGGKLVVTGIGKSGKVVEKIAATLTSTGSLAVFLHPTEALHGDLGVVDPRDTVLVLSYTGNTEEILRLLPSLKARGCRVVGLTGGRESKLAQGADTWVDASVPQEACPHNLAPTSSTTWALVLGDALAMALMKVRGFDPTGFAKNHPAGSLGNRLTLRVRDLMKHGDEVGVLPPTSPMEHVVETLTRKNLGAVLVVDAASKKLLGLVTDGDLRRALKQREKFFALTAAQVMTASPIGCAPDQLAFEAFELMENRPQQISVLPVVEPDSGIWRGLVRLHDLVNYF